MATYRAPSKDEAEKIRSNGIDPAGVVVDDRTGDVFGADDVPGPDYLTENLKSFARAVPTVVTGPLRLGGAAADAVRQLTGEYDINDPSALTQSADWIERKASEFAPQDPRANGLATIPGQVVGQIAGVLGGSKLASMLGSRALSSMAGNAIGQSAAMTAGDTIQEEMDRQAREEITQDPARALAKGLVTGSGTALLEGGIGVGKFLRSLDEPAGTTLGNVLKRAGLTGVSESGQEVGQMQVVEEELAPKGIGMRALAGFLGGNIAGGAQGLALPTAATKTKPAAGVSGKDMAAASKTQAADTAQQLTLLDDTTRQALLLSQRTGQKYEPGISSPHIKAATDLIDLGVPLDGIREGQAESALDRIAKAKPADLPLLSKQLYDEHFLANPGSQETTVKLVAERSRELDKIESQLDKLRNRQKKLQDEQVKSAARGPGPEWMARNDATIQNELAWIDQEGNRLVAQKEMLLGQLPPKPAPETGVVPGVNEMPVNLPPRGPIADTTSEVAVGQPQQIQPAPPWVTPSEGEQRLPFGPSVSPGSISGARPVPESPAQIAGQLQLTADPASTKKATLITPGSEFDFSEVQLPMVRTPHGIVFYNPQKTSEAEVIAGTSGDVADGSLFGYGPGQTSGVAGELAVDTTVAGTPGVPSQVIRNENEAQAAVAAQQAAAPGGETQVKPVGQVIEERRMQLLPDLHKLDVDYAQALKAGNLQDAQKLVDTAAEQKFSASQIRDRTGNLLPVYHGSRAYKPFTVFDRSRSLEHGGVIDHGYHGTGHYFSANPGVAEGYAETNREGLPYTGPVLKTYLDIRNPALPADLAKLSKEYFSYGRFLSSEESRRVTQELKRLGYDGVVAGSGAGKFSEVVAFYPWQIKSADPVVKSDDGSVIPPSQRFDSTEVDIRYSALLPGEDLWNDIKKSFRQQHSFNDETILTAGPAVLYDFAQSSLGRMARDNPLRTYGAVVANKMFIDRNATMGRKERELEPLKPFLQDDRAKKWINDSTDTQTWDISKLPADLQPLGAEFVKFHESFLDETIALGQHVMDPVTGRSRLPIEIPGHFPYTIKPEFYQELAEGGPRADYWTDVWVKSYQAQTGDYTPAGKKRAEEALRLQIGPMSNITIIGGEPIFLAFRRVHGINIPTEMRDDNLLGAYENYIDRYAQDRAWTVHVQDDPLARRAFGATTDKQFNKVDDSAVEPNETQWEDILQAARRYNSPWLSRVQPGMNLGTGVSQDSPEALAFIQSFIQRPLQAQTQGARLAQAGNALASSALMQTTSGIRDASAGLAMGAEYVDMSKMAKNTVSVLADYAAARDNALQSGAMQSDVFRHQAAGVIGKGMYRAIRGFRTLTGRQIMDQYPRVVLHATAYEQVLQDLNSGNKSPLANEFCTPSTRAKGSNDEIARETAANIVERVAPSYDARNLPPGLVPQTANWLGHMLGLARWGVARYANWYEDTLRPALRHGDMSRLIKSLFTGLLGSAATGVLIELLRDKKPANLTWQEWLKLDSEDQTKQAAPLFLSLYQVNGTFGIAGDMMLPLVNAAAGTEPLRVESAEPLMPVMIVGKRLAETAVSFQNYAGQKNWNLDSEDLADLSVELMSNMQLFRDLRGWTLDEQTKAEKELGREVNLYQRLEGRSAKTGNQREIPRLPVFNEPFTLSKEFNNRDMAGLRSLVPALVDRAKAGESLPAVMQNEYKDEFWLDVAKRRGIGATRRLYKANEGEQEEDEVRKELLQELNRIKRAAE